MRFLAALVLLGVLVLARPPPGQAPADLLAQHNCGFDKDARAGRRRLEHRFLTTPRTTAFSRRPPIRREA